MARFLSEERKIIVHAAHDRVGVSMARQDQRSAPVPLYPPRLWIVAPPHYRSALDAFQNSLAELFFQSGIFGDAEYVWDEEPCPIVHDSVLLVGSQQPPTAYILEKVIEHHQRGGAVLGMALQNQKLAGWEDFLREVFGVRLGAPSASGRFEIRCVAAGHYFPMLQGVSAFATEASFPHCRAEDPAVATLLTAHQSGRRLPVAWVKARGGQRRFGTLLGAPHDFQKPGFLALLRNAILWTRGEI